MLIIFSFNFDGPFKSDSGMVAAFDTPKGITVHQLPHSLVWYNHGIVYIAYRESRDAEAGVSLNQLKAELHSLRNIIGDKKVCILAQDRKSPVSEKDQEQFVTEQFTEFTSAMAIVTRYWLKAVCLNMLLSLIRPRGYPVKYFLREKNAIGWLKEKQNCH